MSEQPERIRSSVGEVVIGGGPPPAEVAAIVAAIEALWPKPLPPASPRKQSSTAWRYSGRWWSEGRLPNHWT
jgi:hypothetical protein